MALFWLSAYVIVTVYTQAVPCGLGTCTRLYLELGVEPKRGLGKVVPFIVVVRIVSSVQNSGWSWGIGH